MDIDVNNLKGMYYVMNDCDPLKFIYWSPNPLRDDSRGWELWEVIWFRWHHEDGAPIVGLASYL